MSIPKISICVFIRNNNEGAFCLWESMATLMPIADEYFVLDLGSTDGTWEILKRLAERNPKIRLERGEFPVNPENGLVDAGSFAILPNQMIPTCRNDLVLYYQADEIWHEHLMKHFIKRLENLKDFRGFSFWRYQLKDNFQYIKWHPHIVHRLDYKDQFHFVVDGMNTARVNDAEMCSNLDAGWFTRWGAEFSRGRIETVDVNGNAHIYGEHTREIKVGDYPYKMPTNEMILDISNLGGFRENIRAKSRFHAPMWRVGHNAINVDGKMIDSTEWYAKEKNNTDWIKETSPFDLPDIMKPLVGEISYPVRDDVLDKIADE